MTRPLRTLSRVALLACGFTACGGAEQQRPTTERTLATPPDECLHGEEYAGSLTPITSFDLSTNGDLLCGSADTFWCDKYANHDANHEPPDGGDCQQSILDGQVVAKGTVVETFTTNLESTERCGAPSSAMHFVAMNLGMCKGTNGRLGWGGAYEIDFTSDRAGDIKAPIDASGYDGFSFWLKRGTGRSGGAIIVLAVDAFAAGSADQIDPETGEPVSCKATEPAIQPLPEADNDKCDPFSVGATLTEEWTFFAVRFSDLQQKGFGAYAPEGFKPEELMRLQFIVNAGDWDFWLDDISFFNDP